MKNKKICFSKRIGLAAVIVVVIAGMVGLAIAMTSIPSTSTNTRASGCEAGKLINTTGGVSTYMCAENCGVTRDNDCPSYSHLSPDATCRACNDTSGNIGGVGAGDDYCCVTRGDKADCEILYSGPGTCVSGTHKCAIQKPIQPTCGPTPTLKPTAVPAAAGGGGGKTGGGGGVLNGDDYQSPASEKVHNKPSSGSSEPPSMNNGGGDKPPKSGGVNIQKL